MEPSVRRLFDIFPALYVVFDQQCRLLHVSKGAGILLGYQPSELIGNNMSLLVNPEDLPKAQQAINQLRQGNSRPGFTCSLRHKAGILIPISWYGILDGDNQNIYAVGQKAAPAANFSALQDGAGQDIANPEGVLMLDSNWKVTYINKEAALMLGASVDELLHSMILDYIPEHKHPFYQNYLSKAIGQNMPVRFETFSANLHQQWFEINAFPYQGGVSVFFRNIDAEKQAQEELWKLSLIARETNNIVLLTDAYGSITWVNDAFSRITGYSADEVMGLMLSSLLNGTETDTATTLFIQEAIENGTSFRAEVLQYDKQGKKLWMEVQGQPVKDGTGTVQQFFSIQTDITQRKLFEEQLKQEQQQRQRKITRATIEAQERERSLVSQELHDNVNQVLTTVKLYTELCLSGIDQQEELLRKSLNLLQESINEIRSLSKRLSAPTLGKFRLRDSVKELTESIEATNRLFIDADISLLEDLEVPQELHLGIYRILQEHFTNILKHSSASKVQVSFKLVNEELVLKVRDDGKGFDTKELRSGIGIANMFSRAESLKGTLTLNSAPGLGCVLLVRFPLAS